MSRNDNERMYNNAHGHQLYPMWTKVYGGANDIGITCTEWSKFTNWQ